MIRETEPQSRRDKRARIAKVFKGVKPCSLSELKHGKDAVVNVLNKKIVNVLNKKSKAASDGAKTE